MARTAERLKVLEGLRPPELWPDIRTRQPRSHLGEAVQPHRLFVAALAFVVAAAGIGLAALTFGGSTPPRRPSAGVSNGRIAFVALHDDTWQLFSVEPDGTGLVRLTDLEASLVASSPAWSPDGRTLAYTVRASDTDRSHIWVMDRRGSAHAITEGPGGSSDPAWSPDRSRIAFVRSRDGNYEIYVMNADGSNSIRLTDDPEFDLAPAWSPDGERIAFQSNRDGNNDIYTMDVAGGDIIDLTDAPGSGEFDPAWSPDGTRIAFVSDRDGHLEIYVMASDGSSLTRLTTDAAHDWNPTWSPDGSQIAFESDRDGPVSLYAMNADGTGVHQIPGLPFPEATSPSWQPVLPDQPAPEPGGPMANGPIYFRVGGGDAGSRVESIEPDGTNRHVVFPEDSPVHYSRIDFSPDGTRIAFDNFLAGEYGIETADPDGSDVVRLTDGVNDSWASWSPDGNEILFSSTRYDPSIARCTPGYPHEFGCPTDIYVMDADGSNVVRLTSDPADEFMPAWSPDGTTIAFVRNTAQTPVSRPAIFTMRPDGSDVRQISSGIGGSDWWPSWSPDGSRIAFAAIRKENWGIWTVGADGQGERMVLGGMGAGYVDNPVWSPDGSLIAFVGNLEVDDYSPDDALYVMRPDGTGVTPLADAPGMGVAGDIAWQPLPAVAEPVEPSPTTPPSDARVVETFKVGEDVRSIAYGEGSVWVATSINDGTLGGHIVRIDPTTNEVQAEIPVDAIPSWEVGGGAMVFADGDLWVAGDIEKPGAFNDPGGGADAAVVRIDASTNAVEQTFELGGTSAADLTSLDGDLWVLLFGDESVNENMEVVRVSPSTGDVVARISLETGWGHTIVAAQGRLVVLESGPGATNAAGDAAVIDPVTNAVSRVEIPSEYMTPMPVVSSGQVWISLDPGFARLDPQAAAFPDPVATVPPRFSDCCGFVEADDRGIWFLNLAANGKDRALSLFDADTGVARELAVLDEGTPVAMAVAPDSVWLLSYEGTLTHVDLG
jgi:Tol biopolymer transport system component